MTREEPRPFRLLYVCVGNVSRSVFAERLTRREVNREPAWWARHVQVSSAGTQGRDGQPMHATVARLLSTWGSDPTGFAARRTTAALLRDTDLVLTATTQVRDDVVGMLPATLRRTFTINEFTRLTTRLRDPDPDGDPDADPAQRARHTVTAALALRGRVPQDAALPDVGVLPDDITDPIGGPDALRECGLSVERVVPLVVRALRGPVCSPQIRGARGPAGRSISA